MNELQRRLHPYPATDVRYVPTPAEQLERIQAVTPDDVKAVYAGLVGGGTAEAAAVGDFDPAELTAALGKHFDDWKSPKPFERIARSFLPTKPETLVLPTPDKPNAMFALGLAVELRDDDPDYPALFMANFILGGGSNGRVVNRIRQKEGLSYSVSSTLQAGALDRAATFTCAGICAPQNAEKALACAREEIVRLLAEGVTQAELDDARKGHRQAIEVQLANDAGVAGQLVSGLFHGRTLKFSEEQQAKIDALAPKDLAAAFAKYVKPEGLVVIRAGDFASKAGPGAPAGPKEGD